MIHLVDDRILIFKISQIICITIEKQLKQILTVGGIHYDIVLKKKKVEYNRSVEIL